MTPSYGSSSDTFDKLVASCRGLIARSVYRVHSQCPVYNLDNLLRLIQWDIGIREGTNATVDGEVYTINGKINADGYLLLVRKKDQPPTEILISESEIKSAYERFSGNN